MLSDSTVSHICFGLGIIVLLDFFSAIYRQWKLKRWCSTTGLIIDSKAKKKPNNALYPVIRYAYEVDGKIYHSDRIYPNGIVARSDEHTEQLVRDFPVEEEVPVFYKPSDPSRSALLRSLPTRLLIPKIVVATVFLIIGSTVEMWL